MANRTSVKGLASKAQQHDEKLRKRYVDGSAKGPKGAPALDAATVDSFNNFAHRMGVGADNPLSTSTYGFNPITRNRVLLEWIHRGSWLGGLAIDLVADDMTRAGIEYVTEIPPDQSEEMDRVATSMNTWGVINEVVSWGRLYGGAVAVALIDGQDMRTPLRLDTVGPGDYKGMLAMDRWMLEPSLEDLVTEFGPNLGLPRFYRVSSNAPALRGCAIHHTRILIRHAGNKLPYHQRLTENLWGTSVIERLFDRMVAFDSASTGAAQLVFKSFLRTLSVEGLRDVVAAGGTAMAGLLSYVENMRRYQGIEGISLIDAKDKLDVQSHQAFSGLSDALMQFGQQLSGALQIPLVRLFGQSPAGLSATGESDLRTYYDNIAQQQQNTLHTGVTTHYRLLAKSESIPLPPGFTIGFKSLWQLTDTDKANIAKTGSDTVMAVHESGLISDRTALKELRQLARLTGVFSNITRDLIAQADEATGPPEPEGGFDLPDVSGMPGAQELENPGGQPTQGDMNGNGQAQQEGQVDQGQSGGAPVQHPTPRRSPAGGWPR